MGVGYLLGVCGLEFGSGGFLVLFVVLYGGCGWAVSGLSIAGLRLRGVWGCGMWLVWYWCWVCICWSVYRFVGFVEVLVGAVSGCFGCVGWYG